MLKTTINANSYNHCSIDSCSSLLYTLLVPKSKYWKITQSQIQIARRCQVQIELCMLSSWLCYHIKLPDSQLPSKNWLISMPELFPWSRIEYKFPSQNLWICYSPSSASMVLWADSKHWKACNDIHEVNLSHMHSVLLAPALLQQS